jgi:predicted DNA-binding transcriptional regulator AlpA
MSETQTTTNDDDDLKDIDFVCRYFGGNETPLHPSTVYRKIAEEIIPPPEDMGPKSRMSRWRMSKLRTARQRIFDRTDGREVA